MNKKPSNKDIIDQLRKQVEEIKADNEKQNLELQIKIGDKMREFGYAILGAMVTMHALIFMFGGAKG